MGGGADAWVMLAGESVAREGTLHQLERDVAPGEAVFVHSDGQVETRQCSEKSERSEEHTSELQSPCNLVCRLLLEKKKMNESEKSGEFIFSSIVASKHVRRLHPR